MKKDAQKTKNQSIPALSKEEADKLWDQYKADHVSMQQSRPAKGVKMVEFDQYGFQKGLGDYRKVFDVGNIDMIPEHEITDPSEGLQIGVKYYPPPDGVVIPQHIKDVDLEFQKMTQEQRAVFECLDNEEMIDEYQDLDDNFVISANQNRPALEVVVDAQEVEKQNKLQKKVKFEDQSKKQDDDINQNEITLPKRAKGLMTAQQLAFLNRRQQQQQKDFQKVLKRQYNVKNDSDNEDDDSNQQEYEDYSGEEEEYEDEGDQQNQYYCVDRPGEKLDSLKFNRIIQEYLQQKQIPKKLLDATLPKKQVLYNLVDEQVALKQKQQIKCKKIEYLMIEIILERVLRLVAQQMKEEEEAGSDQDLGGEQEQQETEDTQNKKWDIETVQIYRPRSDQDANKEIPRKLMQKIVKMKRTIKKNQQPIKKIQQDTEEPLQENDDISQQPQNSSTTNTKQLTTKQVKKLNKKKVKQQRKQRREAKKANKLAFKSEEKKLVQFNVNPNNFASGLSVKKIN